MSMSALPTWSDKSEQDAFSAGAGASEPQGDARARNGSNPWLTLFPLGAAFAPRRALWSYGFALMWIAVAVMLFADRDIAPIFGHLSEFAGGVPVP